MCLNEVSRDSVYSDWLRAGWPTGRSSSPGRNKNFLFSISSRLSLRLTQPTILPRGQSPIQGALPNIQKLFIVPEVTSQSEQARGRNPWSWRSWKRSTFYIDRKIFMMGNLWYLMNLYISHNHEDVCIKQIRNEQNSPDIGWIVLGVKYAVHTYRDRLVKQPHPHLARKRSEPNPISVTSPCMQFCWVHCLCLIMSWTAERSEFESR
jgi:hypothetical protein